MTLHINGNAEAHASAEVDFAGKVYLGITDINYSDELTREGVWGTASEQLGVTRGELKQNGDFTFLKSEFDRLLDNSPDGYGEIPFNISITYREPGKPVKINTLRSCFIVKVEDSSSQGSSGMKVKLGLHIAEPIERNGKKLIKTRKRPRVAIRA
jgi:hypothetical protein